MYRFAKVTIYLGFAFIVTIFDLFKLIINYQVNDQPFETGGQSDHHNVYSKVTVIKCYYSSNLVQDNYSVRIDRRTKKIDFTNTDSNIVK